MILSTVRERPRLAFAMQWRLELKRKTPLMGFFRCYLPFRNALTLCTARERPRLAFARQRRLELKRTPDGFLSLLSSFPKQLISAHGDKGLKRRDGKRDTPSMFKST